MLNWTKIEIPHAAHEVAWVPLTRHVIAYFQRWPKTLQGEPVPGGRVNARMEVTNAFWDDVIAAGDNAPTLGDAADLAECHRRERFAEALPAFLDLCVCECGPVDARSHNFMDETKGYGVLHF
jgi:hypothetical protein